VPPGTGEQIVWKPAREREEDPDPIPKVVAATGLHVSLKCGICHCNEDIPKFFGLRYDL
jgi:hypothetical protein